MIVKFKRYHKDAKIPTQAYDKDFCVDLYAVSEEEIAPNVWKYGFGFGLQIVRSEEIIYSTPLSIECGKSVLFHNNIDLKYSPIKLSIDIRPRSSVWKTGMVLSNCEGTIDEGYTGEISAIFYHVLPNMKRYTIGQKIAQMKIGVTFPCTFVVVDELSATDRNSNGYGSSSN